MNDKNKYKPCCGRRCLLSKCATRDQGGCYCLCRLKDREGTILSLLAGRFYRRCGGIIYDHNRKPIPLEGEERDRVLKDIEAIRAKIKTYENENEFR